MEARAHIPVGPPIHKPRPSYWHDHLSPLANLIEPSTFTPTAPYTHIIIGSGISGTMIAYFLLQIEPSAKVLMLEAREVCSGATGRNGGHTKAASYRSYLAHREELGKEEALKIARLEYSNIGATHALAEELSVKEWCESEMCRTVDVIYDRDTFEAGCKAVDMIRGDAEDEEKEEGKMAWYQGHGPDDTTLQNFHITSLNQNPAIQAQERVAGIFEYTAGRIHAYRFTTSILKQCVQMGLQICTNTPVHSITQAFNDTWAVHTQFGSISTPNIILATNGYTPYLLADMQSVIVPMRGQITAQQPGPHNRLTTPLNTTYSFIYTSGYEYMIPRPLKDGRQHIIIGGGLGRLSDAGATEYGTVDDGSLNPMISTYLHDSLIGYFGNVNWGEENDEERIVQEWTGIMGATTDGRPFVGEVPGKRGMWMSAGFNGHGMVLCLKAAEALVGRMGQGRWPEWFPQSFVVSRERIEGGRFGGRRDMEVPV